MLWNFKRLRGFSLRARDGEIGRVRDLFFDDVDWIVRYLVVDTDPWLAGRTVLIARQSLGAPDGEQRLISVDLTRRKVEESPPVESHQPVTRQHEAELLRYYGFSYYWPDPILSGFIDPSLAPLPPPMPAKATGHNEPHLQSSRDLRDFHIHAEDGEIGHVEDFIVADEDWTIGYLVVDTTNWWPGGLALVSPKWIKNIDWKTREVRVAVERQTLREAPEFDPAVPITREYESRLTAHYDLRRKGNPG